MPDIFARASALLLLGPKVKGLPFPITTKAFECFSSGRPVLDVVSGCGVRLVPCVIGFPLLTLLFACMYCFVKIRIPAKWRNDFIMYLVRVMLNKDDYNKKYALSRSRKRS